MTVIKSFNIPSLGKPSIKSPLTLSKVMDDYVANYVDDKNRILLNVIKGKGQKDEDKDGERSFERAGPREKIFFDPKKTRAAIVTCGGLCPGINDVIRAIVMCLWYRYGVRSITGVRFGYRGFLSEFGFPVKELTPEVVGNIHITGGTILGSSRGVGERTKELVDSIERMNLNMVFTIGGDGTQKGALAISREARKRKLNLSVIGVPKTIDNDLSYIDRSFGFETAVERACEAVSTAHVEAHDAINGVGVVKVMGRQSGYIAAHTALSINDVNFVLIPEVPFDIEGENGLLYHLEKRLERRNHAVVLVAEGAGQDLMEATRKIDASGNIRLSNIGRLICSRISDHYNAKGKELNLKYINPGYMIRGAPANPSDSLYCARLGTNAADAAMAGKTELLVSLVNNHYVYVPMALSISSKNSVDPESSLWRDVIAATGQHQLMKTGRT